MTGYTDAYIEREIQIEARRNGGFSTFWVDQNPHRARVASEMFKDGRLVSDGGQYPWVKCHEGQPKGGA